MTLDERLEFRKLAPEEMEAEIQKAREEDSKLTEWPYIDANSSLDL